MRFLQLSRELYFWWSFWFPYSLFFCLVHKNEEELSLRQDRGLDLLAL